MPLDLTSAEFEQLLAGRPFVVTEHFALHVRWPLAPLASDLSTGAACSQATPVDGGRFGQVVPKRHAKRAVTRSLIKRQGRAAWSRHAAGASLGAVVLRLRRAYPIDSFPSAASAALRAAVKAELDVLFDAVGCRQLRTDRV